MVEVEVLVGTIWSKGNRYGPGSRFSMKDENHARAMERAGTVRVVTQSDSGSANEPATSNVENQPVDELEGMSRQELIAALKEAGVTVQLKWTNVYMKSILRRKKTS
jgi:hypothetical protein